MKAETLYQLAISRDGAVRDRLDSGRIDRKNPPLGWLRPSNERRGFWQAYNADDVKIGSLHDTRHDALHTLYRHLARR